MQLTKEQIQSLFTFTKQHFVEWYDLQCELVDHLTNDIEHIWQTEPNLSFEQARDKAFKKFGIFGFSDVIEKKQYQLDKKYWKLTWKHFKDYFKLPKIVLTAFLIALVYSLFNLFENKSMLFNTFIIISTIIMLTLLALKNREIKKQQKETGKKWLFQNNIMLLGGLNLFCQIPINLINVLDKLTWTTNNQIIVATFIILYAITCYIISQIIPKKIEEDAAKLYPKYNLYQKA